MPQVTAAFSVAFSADGAQLFGGYRNSVRIFDVGRPGRDYQEVNVLGRKGCREVGGMVSTIHCLADSSLYAIGSFSTKVGLYDRKQRRGLVALLQGHRGGVTQVCRIVGGCCEIFATCCHYGHGVTHNELQQQRVMTLDAMGDAPVDAPFRRPSFNALFNRLFGMHQL